MTSKTINTNNNTLQINQFKIESMGENPKIAVIAKSGSGKSWVIRDIMYHLRHIPVGTIIAPTDRLSHFYDDFVPSLFINHEYDPTVLQNLMDRQLQIAELNEERRKQGKKTVNDKAFFIMDDCMASKKEWLHDRNVLSLFNEGRHYKITYILAMQYSLGIQPELRSNFDYIFLLGEDFHNNKRKLYEHYCGMFPSYSSFEQVFTTLTDDYGCMVIDNRKRVADITKKVYWYKAVPRNDFMVGSRKFKEFNRICYDEKYKMRDRGFDFNKNSKKSNTFNIEKNK